MELSSLIIEGTYAMRKEQEGAVTVMNNIPDEHKLTVQATEINMIKYQTGKTVIVGSVEIGRRLTEDKGLVKYGE